MSSTVGAEQTRRSFASQNSVDEPLQAHENDSTNESQRHDERNPLPASAGHSSVDPAAVVNDTGPISSLDLPKILTADRVRRRSELSRNRPFKLSTSVDAEAIELPAINEQAKATSSSVRVPDLTFHEDAISVLSIGKGDVELASSFPSSLAPSIRVDEDVNSESPAISAEQKALYRRRFLINFVALCFCSFLNGWNDGTTGPLLPRIQSYYHVGFGVVSIIFVMNAVGFISGAFANVWLTDRFGFGKIMVFGSICQLSAYALIAPAGPFPLLCIAFMITGFGLSLQNSHCNGYIASSNAHGTIATKMGFLHASYGFGALVAPLVSTQFAVQKHWSFHYLISAVLCATNCASLWCVFRGKRQNVIKAESGDFGNSETETTSSNKYKQIFGLREIHLLSVFALIYVGSEVTIGGWSVTYVQEKRHGNSSAGYISSGFFGGLMLGRILLISLNQKIGERRALFIYALLAIQLEVTVWVVPSLIENAVAVAFIGLLMGPMYPILMNHSTTILPRWLITGCMGYIASVGMAGSAVLPFLTGLLASKFGIASLQPFIVSMMSTMIVVWALIPRVRHVPT